MQRDTRTRIITLLAALLLGAGAGVVSSILTSTALENYANALLGERGFTSIEPRKPNTNPQDYAEAVNRVREVQARSLAVITAETSDTESVTNLVGPSDQVGVGIVVSANGWILTTQEQLESFSEPAQEAEVWVREARYAMDEVVEDSLTDYVLIKLVGANGLSPVGFGASEDGQSGDVVFVTPSATGLVATSLETAEAPSLSGPQPAEVYVTNWELAAAEPGTGPVLSSGGDLLAFANSEGTEPLHHGRAFIQEIIRNGAPAHASLGAYVLPLSDIYNLDIDLSQGLSSGVLVIAPTGTLAVPARGPAGQAGLRTNDLILSVDDEAITQNTSLSEILANYDPGQTARLDVLRAGAQLEIDVTLGDAETLVY